MDSIQTTLPTQYIGNDKYSINLDSQEIVLSVNEIDDLIETLEKIKDDIIYENSLNEKTLNLFS